MGGYERVLGLKKSLVRSLILVFDAISPENRLSNGDSFMSRLSTHNIQNKLVKLFFFIISEITIASGTEGKTMSWTNCCTY